jgi:2-aminobenzoate-CoA ligase
MDDHWTIVVGSTMKDTYPQNTTLPAQCLVPANMQPDYEPYAFPTFNGSYNIADHLADAHVAAGSGEIIASINSESGKTYTFAELARESEQLANGLLELGIKQGDRVAYLSTNDPEVLIVMLAIWKAGGVVVPIPAYAKGADIQHFVSDTSPRFVFAHSNIDSAAELQTVIEGTSVEHLFGFGPGNVPGARPVNEIKQDGPTKRLSVDPDQVAIIWYTGGTTGRPKGCYHTHRRFLAGGYSYAEGNNVVPGQRWAATAPIGHALGIIYHTIFTLLHGATAVFIENFSDPQLVLRAVSDHSITSLTGLMASWAKMADYVRKNDTHTTIDTSSLSRCFAMWQAASSADVYDFWLDRGVELLNNFGSTSFANWVLVPQDGNLSPRAALGTALPGYIAEAAEIEDGSVRILPEGEIGRLAVKGPTGLTYWNLPELQARDVVEGWTLSDDLVKFDENGQAHYLGRSDYMISTGGYKVAPVEVEEALSRHPDVHEVSVVPAACPTLYEKVMAYIALKPGVVQNDTLKQELRDFVKATQPYYKVPREIYFVDALPRDDVGKVQTKIVKNWADTTS